MKETEEKYELDLLRHIERLTEQLNMSMSKHGKPALARYPLTFTLLALFGVIAVDEGVKGVLASFGILDGHPWELLLLGLIILLVTGSLYKKLDR